MNILDSLPVGKKSKLYRRTEEDKIRELAPVIVRILVYENRSVTFRELADYVGDKTNRGVCTCLGAGSGRLGARLHRDENGDIALAYDNVRNLAAWLDDEVLAEIANSHDDTLEDLQVRILTLPRLEVESI